MCSKFIVTEYLAILSDFVIPENVEVSRGTETGFPRVFAVAVRYTVRLLWAG